MEGTQTQTTLYGFETRLPDKRRVDPELRKTHNIKMLWQRNHEIINLASLGYKGTEIAYILNIDPQTVSNTLNSDLGKAKLAELREGKDEEVKRVHEKIRVLTERALDVYHDIFDDESGECNLKDKKAAADTVVLELSGLRAPTKIHSTSVSTQLTADELAAVKERGLKAIENSRVPIQVNNEPKTETE